MKHILALAGLATLLLSSPTQGQTKELSVCELIQTHPPKNSSLVIRVKGEILADKHSILIISSSCDHGIYLKHDWGQSNDQWAAFDKNLIQKRSVEETRPLFITLDGIYSIEKEGGKELRVIKVTRVISSKFGENESKPSKR